MRDPAVVMDTRGPGNVVRLLPGPDHFGVDELLAYEPSGAGEHLYVHVEKRDLTTDMVASTLARLCGQPRRAVGFAGKKDRQAVTRQWFSVLGGREEALAELTPASGGRARVLCVDRHRNKLRLGHLRGNRFRLLLEVTGSPDVASPDEDAARPVEGPTAPDALEQDLGSALDRLAHTGVPHRFGPQRFGRAESTLRIARALALDQPWDAVRWLVAPDGRWEPGSPLPAGGRRGLEGRVFGALQRRPDDPRGALRAAGRDFLKLAASAAQASIFNAVFDARRARDLLHEVRPGDVVRKWGAGAFVCAAEDLDDARRRAAPGCLELIVTGPMPGTSRLTPSPDIALEERAWSAETGIDWAWFAKGAPLESPGERRPLVVPFLEAPRLARVGAGRLELCVALPAGCYATELLREVGVRLPARRAAARTQAADVREGEVLALRPAAPRPLEIEP